MNKQKNVSANGKRVPAWHWMVLVGVIAGVVAIGATYAKGAVRGEAGFISNGADVCESNAIGPKIVDLLEEYSILIHRLHAAGGYVLSDEDMMRGMALEKVCGEIDGDQKAHVILVDGDFILVEFDDTVRAGFFMPYITRASNFVVSATGLSL